MNPRNTVPAAIPDGIGRELAAAVASIEYANLPPEVIDTVKLFTLDTLGVIGGAATAPGMAELLATLSDLEDGGKATLLLSGGAANPAAAAMANAAAAHSLDFDDQHDPARVHVFCVVLPAVLAAVEGCRAQAGSAPPRAIDGQHALAAIATGVEVFSRLGLACYNSLGKGWHPTTALGSIAAAAAVSKVLSLNAEQTMHAMAIAFVQLSGTTQFIADGALAKRLGPGFAARSGLTAAYLARRGITGPWRYLEGAAGLFHLYERDEVKPEILTHQFGTAWEMLQLSMKPFPCCRCTHTVIQLAQDFRAAGIRGADIASGVIELSRVNRQIVGSPFNRMHANPTVHAQFNAAYTFAAGLTDGTVTIASFGAAAVRREATAWAAKLTTQTADDMEDTALPPARVRLTLTDGRTLERVRWKMKGSPDEPMSSEEIIAKFRSCLQYGLDAADDSIEALRECVMTLEAQPDAGRLIELFGAARKTPQQALRAGRPLS